MIRSCFVSRKLELLVFSATLLGQGYQLLGALFNSRLYDYRQKIDTIADRLAKISGLEKENSEDLDRLSGYFGEVLAEIFAVIADAC